MKPDVRNLYRNAPFIMRHMQALRLLIAPFDDLMVAVPDGARVLDVGMT